MPSACARASTCFLNCLCSLVLVLLTAVPLPFCCVVLCFVVLGGGASQRQRDERLHRLTLLFVLFSSFLVFLLFFVWNGVCCVVRAQLCEHARNTTHALMFWLST